MIYSSSSVVNDECIEALQYISSLPETKIIIWSSAFEDDVKRVFELFEQHNITPHFFNENPLVENTSTGNFDKKFYFSLLLDDKAGFDPDVDWRMVKMFVNQERVKHGLNHDNISIN